MPFGLTKRPRNVPTRFEHKLNENQVANMSRIHGWYNHLFKKYWRTHPSCGGNPYHTWRGWRHTQSQNVPVSSDSVSYLGHTINSGRVEIDQTNTYCLKDAKKLDNRAALRSFLGICNVYRRFIWDFKGIANPLNKLLHNGRPQNVELDGKNLSN